jgi:hypothetical protein
MLPAKASTQGRHPSTGSTSAVKRRPMFLHWTCEATKIRTTGGNPYHCGGPPASFVSSSGRLSPSLRCSFRQADQMKGGMAVARARTAPRDPPATDCRSWSRVNSDSKPLALHRWAQRGCSPIARVDTVSNELTQRTSSGETRAETSRVDYDEGPTSGRYLRKRQDPTRLPGAQSVLASLSRYNHRVAISNSRLFALDETGVTFRYKDYRFNGRERYRTLTLDPGEFCGASCSRAADGLPPPSPLWPPRQRRPQGQHPACSRVLRPRPHFPSVNGSWVDRIRY